MSSAPIHLIRCPLCLALHPWREAPRSALSVERVQPHTCSHGLPCGVRLCEHGKPYSEISAEPTVDGPTILRGCNGGPICIDTAPRCKDCAAARAKVYANLPISKPGCVVCREVERQSTRTGCLSTKKRTTKPGEVEFVPDPNGCAYKMGLRPPPWCAGATEAEQKMFLEALPEPLRTAAIAEARKANRQEGAGQKAEAPKVDKKPKEDRQRSLF